MPYFLFEPDAPAAVHTVQPLSQAHPQWTYMYATEQGLNKWFIRDTKNAQWLAVMPEGVPENYRLELLLLQAAHP